MIEAEIVWEPVYKTARYQLAVRNAETQKDLVRPAIFDRAPSDLPNENVVAAGLLLTLSQPLIFHFRDPIFDSVIHKWEKVSSLSHQFKTVSGSPRGSFFTDLEVSLSSKIETTTPGKDETILGLFPSERFYGAFKGIKETYLASNIWMMDEGIQPNYQVAAGVLFASELMARSVRISIETDAGFSLGAQRILAGIDLELKAS